MRCTSHVQQYAADWTCSYSAAMLIALYCSLIFRFERFVQREKTEHKTWKSVKLTLARATFMT